MSERRFDSIRGGRSEHYRARSSDGGGGNGLEARVASIETHLRFVATKEDVKDVLAEVKEVRSDVKIWFLRGVIGAGVVAVGWLVYLLAPFIKSLLSTN